MSIDSKNEIVDFCNNIIIKEGKTKVYFSLTSENNDDLDKVTPIIEKYISEFNKLGITVRVKDRRK